MTVGIVGLGLIGASLAKTIKKHTDFAVMGYDLSEEVMESALLDGTIDERLNLGGEHCDMILVALYPDDVVDFVSKNADLFNDTIVIDCGGTKKKVCDSLFPVAREHGFTFIGGHPMAGIEKSGYAASTDSMFDGAFMILVPDEGIDKMKLDYVKMFFISIGFHRITLTTAKEHDEIIAYTSQLAHVVSSAYVKSPTSVRNLGFSAGSFKDMTRVAFLNEPMWTELFFQNKQFLLNEVDIFIENMKQYREALANLDRDEMMSLLAEGKKQRIAAWTAVSQKK